MSFHTVCDSNLSCSNCFKFEFKVARCLLTLPLNFAPLMDTMLFTLEILATIASNTSVSFTIEILQCVGKIIFQLSLDKFPHSTVVELCYEFVL